MSAPSRLRRRLGLGDAIVIGLGSMIGAGIFAALGPAARAAGSYLLVGLVVAGAIAYCNATSSARLAAVYPESGGTYVYARRELGTFWGYLAGMCFVAGKLASCAAMALTFAHYTAPGLARPLAVAAVVALSAVNLGGVEKTARLTTAIVGVVLAGLAAFVAAALLGGTVSADNILDGGHGGVLGVLRSAGFLFFAFAGYARIATLGEEVRDPERTIPRAIPLALAVTLVVYAAPALAAVHERTRVPHRAEIAVGLVVAAVVATADVRSAIGFSSFCVLVYYALANASALALGSRARRHAAIAVGGLVGCLVVALTLPWQAVAGGTSVVVASALLYALRR